MIFSEIVPSVLISIQDTMVTGKLQDVNASSATGLPINTIPYISCDEPDAMKAITDFFNSTEDPHVTVAVLYSEFQSHCNISSNLALARWLTLVTVSDVDQARQVAELALNEDSAGDVQIFPDPAALSPVPDISPQRRNSPIRMFAETLPLAHHCADTSTIAMIVLYALTSMITMLLLFVIIGGALKARRHPERYGPRAILRPRQSRAKGIAMAMLETLPIVRFGDPDPKQAKREGVGEGGEEMNPVKTVGVAEDKQAKPERQSIEATQQILDTVSGSSKSKTERFTTNETDPPNLKDNTSDPSTSSPQAPESTPPKNADDSLSCSICTEDFTLGEELRVLPCNHKFHPLCVDPWLLDVSGTCPLCRIDLRPPEEAEEEDEGPIVAANLLPRSHSARPRSTIGGIMRGTRGLDLQSIRAASREERIRILRRWREERQRDPAAEDANAQQQRRSRRISQWLRDGFGGRHSPDSHPEQNVRRTSAPRANTWYGGEAGAAGQAPQVPSLRADPAASDERARSWYGGEGAAQRRSLESRSLNGATGPAQR